MNAPRLLGLVTHHKAGTVWMRRVVHRIGDTQGVPVLQMHRARRMAQIAPEGPQIVVNWNGSLPAAFFAREDARVLHLIRDPRDVLLSGTRYHRAAGLGQEPFLAETRPEWNGRSYRDVMRSLTHPLDRMRFEMGQKHLATLTEMLAWPYGHARTVELRYEDLIEDTDCARFRAALEAAGIDGLDIDGAVRAYWENSLFGGLADPAARPAKQARHISSGAAQGWRRQLPREIAQDYADRFGPALRALGYAETDDWVETCRPYKEIWAEIREKARAKRATAQA